MRHPRQEHLVQIAEDGREGLTPLRRSGRERRAHLARLHLRENGQLAHAFAVARDLVARRRPSSRKVTT